MNLRVLAISVALVAIAGLFGRVEGEDPQCNQTCVTDNDCRPSQQCSHCYHGLCQPGLTCGGTCFNTPDCNQETNCSLCQNNVCVSGCSQPCNTSDECISWGCSACSNNVCVLLKCGAACMKDTDCTAALVMCGVCDQPAHDEVGRCLSGCGSICAEDSNCPTRCPFCTSGTCEVFRE